MICGIPMSCNNRSYRDAHLNDVHAGKLKQETGANEVFLFVLADDDIRNDAEMMGELVQHADPQECLILKVRVIPTGFSDHQPGLDLRREFSLEAAFVLDPIGFVPKLGGVLAGNAPHNIPAVGNGDMESGADTPGVHIGGAVIKTYETGTPIHKRPLG